MDHLTTCASDCWLHPRASRENPKWGPFPCWDMEGMVAEDFQPPSSPENHLKQPLSHAGTLGGGSGCSHQGLIRAVSGPSVMDQQEEVAGQWFPD
ncbi:putative cation-transporting ATPase 13A4 [Dissostichus eleginoides]|uniref:Cation-transporting ATPase 13A4 n=1 Tax=Dissostichus eleginoides TaxID=100907 RepID=A0AAD9BDP1_DISEL|nr:putative cation-transporting ATPase 13A4 [Dissostichus eleginoides]